MKSNLFGFFYLVGFAGAYLVRIPALLSANKTMKKYDRLSTRQKFETEGFILGILTMLW